MVKIYKCSFCGADIEPGTGLTYFRADGSALHFCSSKCRKNMLYLKRKARKMKWTAHYPRRKEENKKN